MSDLKSAVMRTCVLLNMPLFYSTVRRQRGHVYERVGLARNPESHVSFRNPEVLSPAITTRWIGLTFSLDPACK